MRKRVEWKALYVAGCVVRATLYWLLVAPIGLVAPRRRRAVVVIGREDGKFLDNAKYALLSAPAGKVMTSFITSDKALAEHLASEGVCALRYPSVRAIARCLMAGAVIADSAEWTDSGRLQLLLRARLIQLWHGIPLKEIELALYRRRLVQRSVVARWCLRLYKWWMGRWPMIDLLVATSQQTAKQLFAPAFPARRIAVCGYPRNDVLNPEKEPSVGALINSDRTALARCQDHRSQGGSVCLYAPTFRDHRRTAFDDGVLDPHQLEAFCAEQNLLFVVKMHPLSEAGVFNECRHVIAYRSTADVYPLLREVDVLCTDYSSIYFDFLLLDRPIVFLSYDLEDYLRDDRAMNMPYADVTPGPLCRTQRELEGALVSALRDAAIFSPARRALRHVLFDDPDFNAGSRFWDEVGALLESR